MKRGVNKVVGAACIAMLAVLAACGDNGGPATPDAPNVVVDAPVDAPVAPTTLTTFVIDQIKNHTNDTGTAVPFATFSTLPDPDGDSNNTAAYTSLFQ